MKSKFLLKYPFMALLLLFALSGCESGSRHDAEFPWSINVPELAVRLVVYDKGVELFQYPRCLIEIMNTSKQTILLRKDFAINGPVIYDKNKEAMPQRNVSELTSTEVGYYRLEPGQKVSIKTAPNYKIEYSGTYFLRFAVHPSLWGFEDALNPGQILPRRSGANETAVSNEVKFIVYSGER